jgi:hypothetical protein
MNTSYTKFKIINNKKNKKNKIKIIIIIHSTNKYINTNKYIENPARFSFILNTWCWYLVQKTP